MKMMIIITYDNDDNEDIGDGADDGYDNYLKEDV